MKKLARRVVAVALLVAGSCLASTQPGSAERALASEVAQQAASDATTKPAEALYLQLRNVGLDPAQTFHIRGASLDRSALHITLEDGDISFTTALNGHITGAFFEGDGELLLRPPSQVERGSIALFTGMAILEERFTTPGLVPPSPRTTSTRPRTWPTASG